MGISRHDIDLVLPKHALAPEKLRPAMSVKSRDKVMTHQCQGVHIFRDSLQYCS